MHKGVIILVEAEDRDDALAEVEIFLDRYEHRVWDWYAIGNRWHNTLAPRDKTKEFLNWVRKEYAHAFKENCTYDPSDLENDEVRPKIQAKWEEMGLKGKNPYYTVYGFDVDEDDYNVQPLKDCIDVVKDWVRDLNKEEEIAWNKLNEEKLKGDKFMVGYRARLYADIIDKRFSFDCNVYNVPEETAEKIPKNIDDYWAVMVDMHC